MDTQQQQHIHNILGMLKKIGNEKFSQADLESLFLALLTPSEIEAISQRLHILQLLHKGTPQRDVSEILGVGVATATRGNRILKENIHLFEKLLESK